MCSLKSTSARSLKDDACSQESRDDHNERVETRKTSLVYLVNTLPITKKNKHTVVTAAEAPKKIHVLLEKRQRQGVTTSVRRSTQGESKKKHVTSRRFAHGTVVESMVDSAPESVQQSHLQSSLRNVVHGLQT